MRLNPRLIALPVGEAVLCHDSYRYQLRAAKALSYGPLVMPVLRSVLRPQDSPTESA